MIRNFYKHVLPTMLALTFSGIFVIIDGLFIGQKIGDVGLAAINIAYPIPALIFALGIGVGMGGGVMISLYKNDPDKQALILGNCFLLLMGFSLCCMIGFQVFFKSLLLFFKASPQIMPYAQAYVQTVIFGIIFNMFGTALSPLVRNFEGQLMAMFAMCTGCIANIILDYLAIFPLNLGLSGAALATIISQALTAFILLLYLQKKGYLLHFIKLRLDFDICKQIIKTGISPFGISICANVIIVIMNRQLAYYGQDHALAIYALISYVYYIAQLLMQGIGEGIQPMISRAIGLQKNDEAQKYLRMALAFCVIFGLTLTIFLIKEKELFPWLFGSSQLVASDSSQILPWFAYTCIFMGITKTITAYFYAAKHDKYAYLLIYLEPILVLICAYVLPLLWQLNGVWISILITQISLSIIAVILLKIAHN
ncbi:MAG: MATE family efflux transporter [Erysipelotrichaceae bacterium]|nr:MATE family efflux transporter [Erysipelotrichaceae bacterium]MDY5252096.1 MATE family efflux transporter [Erysipelotrichaceae bacterium]